jgi:hypothetical protein
LLPVVLLVVVGCSRSGEQENWLIGEWSFDGQMTADNLPAEMKEGMLATQVQQMIGEMGASMIAFTATEVTSTSSDGEAESRGYKILRRPDANTLVIKAEGGRVSTLTRAGEHIATKPSAGPQFKCYFERVR